MFAERLLQRTRGGLRRRSFIVRGAELTPALASAISSAPRRGLMSSMGRAGEDGWYMHTWVQPGCWQKLLIELPTEAAAEKRSTFVLSERGFFSKRVPLFTLILPRGKLVWVSTESTACQPITFSRRGFTPCCFLPFEPPLEDACSTPQVEPRLVSLNPQRSWSFRTPSQGEPGP